MNLFRTIRAAALLAALLAAAGFSAPEAVAQGVPKTCGAVGQPSCPAADPVVTQWSYTVDPGFGKPSAGPFFSVLDAAAYPPPLFVGPATNQWCSSSYTGLTPDVGTPGYTYGIKTYEIDFLNFADVGYQPACSQPFNTTAFLYGGRVVQCPLFSAVTYSAGPPIVGPSCSAPSVPASPMPPDPEKAMGESCPVGSGADSGTDRLLKGNPCDVSNGNKYEKQIDYVGTGPNPLRFVRSYNSLQAHLTWNYGVLPRGRQLVFGAGWMATYFQFLSPVTVTDGTGSHSSVYAYRPDGRRLTFNLYGTAYMPDADVSDSLTATGGGFVYQTANDVVETYDSTGKLLSIGTRGNQAPVTITYDSGGFYPATVTDAFGHALQIAYLTDATGTRRVASITDPAGATVVYGYDTTGNLASVQYQDTTTRGYGYGTATGHNLTTLTDEAAVTYVTWGYNTYGDQVTSSQLAGGVSSYTFSASGLTRTVTDPLGTVRNYTQQLVQNVYRQSAASGLCPGCGEDQSRTFDGNGNVSSRTDFNGNQTTYVFDVTRNLETSRTEGLTSVGGSTPRSRTITTVWDTTFRLPKTISIYAGATATGTALRTTDFTYDTAGNVLTKKVTDPATSTTRTWTYTVDSYGRTLTADGPRTDVVDKTTYAYYTCTTGTQCGLVNTVTDAVGNVTTFNTYNAHGQPLTITDPNGVLTTLAYDARLRVTSRQVSSETTAFSYYPTGLLKRVTLPDGAYVQYTYDGAHRLTGIADGLGNSISYLPLDNMGNHTTENAYDPSSVLSRTRTRVFNTLNQLYQEIGAANTAAVTTTYGYDTNGNLQSVNAPLSRNSTNGYDELNRLAQMTDPGTGITAYRYDATDNLTQVTDPRSLVTGYQYNGFGDVKQLTSPDTGTTNNTFDSGGNLSTKTDARADVATYLYDALNRVTSAAYKHSSTTDQTYLYTYDAGTNGKGRLTGASDAAHSMTWAYDALGRVVSKGQTVGTIAKSVGYAYTSGDVTTLTTPSGQTITYSYANNQVTGITVNSTTLLAGVTYEPFGPVRGWTWGNSTTEVRLHNTDGNPSQISAIESSSYGYDNAYRITGITNASNSALSWTYGYDVLDRMTSASKTGTTQGWTYDANGNRLTQTGTVAGIYTPATTSNRLNSITGTPARTYTHDATGNVSGYGTITYAYWFSGRMKTATVSGTATSYSYNALGQRTKKSGGAGGTVYFVYDETGHLLGEYSSTGALVQETVWMGDTPVATIRPSGSTVAIYYVHADHLNAPRMVTRPSDNKIAWRWDTDPFGTAAPNENPQALGTFKYNLRYPGQYFDVETGLFYNVFRDYDPQTGRYVESDPIGLAGGVDTYSYVRDSPVNSSDPTGLDPSLPPGLAKPDPNRNTVVCDGGGSIVTQLQPLRPLDEKCLGDCLMLHELTHIDQLFKAGMGTACRGARRSYIVTVPSSMKRDAEREAYTVEIHCLRRKLAAITDCDACKRPLLDRLAQIGGMGN